MFSFIAFERDCSSCTCALTKYDAFFSNNRFSFAINESPAFTSSEKGALTFSFPDSVFVSWSRLLVSFLFFNSSNSSFSGWGSVVSFKTVTLWESWSGTWMSWVFFVTLSSSSFNVVFSLACCSIICRESFSLSSPFSPSDLELALSSFATLCSCFNVSFNLFPTLGTLLWSSFRRCTSLFILPFKALFSFFKASLAISISFIFPCVVANSLSRCWCIVCNLSISLFKEAFIFSIELTFSLCSVTISSSLPMSSILAWSFLLQSWILSSSFFKRDLSASSDSLVDWWSVMALLVCWIMSTSWVSRSFSSWKQWSSFSKLSNALVFTSSSCINLLESAHSFSSFLFRSRNLSSSISKCSCLSSFSFLWSSCPGSDASLRSESFCLSLLHSSWTLVSSFSKSPFSFSSNLVFSSISFSSFVPISCSSSLAVCGLKLEANGSSSFAINPWALMCSICFSRSSFTLFISCNSIFNWLWSSVIFLSSSWRTVTCSWSSLCSFLYSFDSSEASIFIGPSAFLLSCVVLSGTFCLTSLCFLTSPISLISSSFAFSSLAIFFMVSSRSSRIASSSWWKELFSLSASSNRFSNISLQTLASWRWKLSCLFWFLSVLISSLIVSHEHRISISRISRFAARSMLSLSWVVNKFLSDSLWWRSLLSRSQSALALLNSNSSFSLSLVTFRRSSSSLRTLGSLSTALLPSWTSPTICWKFNGWLVLLVRSSNSALDFSFSSCRRATCSSMYVCFNLLSFFSLSYMAILSSRVVCTRFASSSDLSSCLFVFRPTTKFSSATFSFIFSLSNSVIRSCRMFCWCTTSRWDVVIFLLAFSPTNVTFFKAAFAIDSLLIPFSFSVTASWYCRRRISYSLVSSACFSSSNLYSSFVLSEQPSISWTVSSLSDGVLHSSSVASFFVSLAYVFTSAWSLSMRSWALSRSCLYRAKTRSLSANCCCK